MTHIKAGVIVFPGTNCDRDTYNAIKCVMDARVDYVWYENKSLHHYQLIVIPGGFSYGDYLRAGALARFSPIMDALRSYVDRGGLVIGICNGFQILLESLMLPGAMQRNKTLKFVCDDAFIRIERDDTAFTMLYKKGDILKIPIAHAEGNYYAPPDLLDRIEHKKQIILRYVDQNGKRSEPSNPNGSINAIAGLCNDKGNILGMMPHPERASDGLIGSEDGKRIFLSIKKALG